MEIVIDDLRLSAAGVRRTNVLGASSLLMALLIVGATGCRETPATTVAPGFDISGIVEGFYGTPWSHEDRLDIIEFMGEVGLNAYFYAPKADPYHLARWRDSYPPQEWERLRELTAFAAANDVTFWYAISPGLTMQYSDRNDYDALIAKIDTVATLGVRHFGLFLDDVPLDLTDSSDVSQFETLARAHTSLISRLHADFVSRGYELAVTPTVYTSAWDSPSYIDPLGADVHPDVYMIWTGPDVFAPQITHEQSAAWSERLGRRLILWDNYPVNDFAPWRLFLGPLRGRDSRLPETTVGFLSNPMNQAHASMLPLYTLADYTSDPESYEPDASWQRGIQAVLGSDGGRALQPILDAFRDDASDTNVLEPLHFLQDTIDLGSIEAAISAMEMALADARALPAPTARFTTILDQLEPTVTRARARLDDLRSDRRYRPDGDRLVFDGTREQFEVAIARGSATPDGELHEWADARWYALQNEPSSEVSFAADDSTLRVALRVQTEDVSIREGSRIGEGTHVALVVMHDDSSTRISPHDLYILIAPGPGGSEASDPSFVGSMNFEGFMAKWLADNERMTFTEFHLTTFGRGASPSMTDMADRVAFGSSRTDTGFTMEIHMPHRQRDQRLSLTVSTHTNGRRSSASLAQRNYPLNPRTFVRMRVPHRENGR